MQSAWHVPGRKHKRVRKQAGKRAGVHQHDQRQQANGSIALQAAALIGSRHSAARSCANTETAHARYDVLTSVAVVELQRVDLVVRVPAQASPGKVAEAMSKATG